MYALAGASTVTKEMTPVFYLEANAAVIKTADVKRFATWAYR